MKATFVSEGRTIDHTPGSAVSAGDVVVQGPLVGVATRDIAASALGALAVEGIFDVAMAAVTITAGAAIYWDADGDPVGGTAGTGAATNVATGNTFMGFAIAARADTATTVRVVLMSTDATALTSQNLSALADVGALAYTAGKIIVADGNSYEEVAVSGDATLASTGAITLAADEKNLTLELADPGDAGAIPVTSTGHVDLVTGAQGQTRTLAAPTYVGQQLLLSLKTDGGGDCVITCATTVNQTGNNTITMGDAGDAVLLVAKANGANKRWSVVSNDGAALSTVGG